MSNIDKIGVTPDEIINEKASVRDFRRPFSEKGLTDVPEYLLNIKITVGDYNLEANLRDILYYGRSDISELDDREIDKALDASSEFRISVGIAYGYLKAQLEHEEYDLAMFEAKYLDEAHEILIAERQKVQGKITQATMQATREEKLAVLIGDPDRKGEWEMLKRRIIGLRRDVTIIQQVGKVLEDRTMLLMSISKRRFIERTGRFTES